MSRLCVLTAKLNRQHDVMRYTPIDRLPSVARKKRLFGRSCSSPPEFALRAGLRDFGFWSAVQSRLTLAVLFAVPARSGGLTLGAVDQIRRRLLLFVRLRPDPKRKLCTRLWP